MLVLTRRRRESITIGDVVITVVKITDGTVRLGVEAPRDTKILRTELLEGTIDEDNS